MRRQPPLKWLSAGSAALPPPFFLFLGADFPLGSLSSLSLAPWLTFPLGPSATPPLRLNQSWSQHLSNQEEVPSCQAHWEAVRSGATAMHLNPGQEPTWKKAGLRGRHFLALMQPFLKRSSLDPFSYMSQWLPFLLKASLCRVFILLWVRRKTYIWPLSPFLP